MHLEEEVNYRFDQLKNHLTTDDSYKIKVTNANSETKWMNITALELKQIATLLNTREEN